MVGASEKAAGLAGAAAEKTAGLAVAKEKAAGLEKAEDLEGVELNSEAACLDELRTGSVG